MQSHQAEEDAITQYPDEQSLPSALNRRTLQRWLNALMAQHRIRREGHARAVNYWCIKPVDSAAQAMRQPVGYKRDFLDSYLPNETAYQSQDIRDELLLQGQVLGGHEPAGTYARQLTDRLLIDLSRNSSRLEGNTLLWRLPTFK
ncbi:hypothetical protein [Limnohabitans sp. DM1]|uniref:hypothetical protein n=1 Tax=Limnohabitans sp. DM1 TaxID=1597955 RepID=UPI000B330DFC|nr:hypothetical protein [Limnohabitans sp. DM1]